MYQSLKDAVEVGSLKPKPPEFYLFSVLIVCGLFLCWRAAEQLKQRVHEGQIQKQEMNAARVRADLPWQIAYEMYVDCHLQPMCYQYAVNLAYRINTETDARAIVVSVGMVSYADKKPKMEGHAMCVFFTTAWRTDVFGKKVPDYHAYVADQNRPPTELDLEKAHYDSAAGDSGWIDLAYHSHLDFSNSGLPSKEAPFDSIWAIQIIDGKADVLKDFGPMADTYAKDLGHLNYFPLPYCFD